ncbi:uncharacterized protein PHACADRAFT_253762 [Phanerochaete carnosa HHB-10118-sp]|uniref:Uncharacterized protein n=1 Tax=Phanerochaete carnosa (strain HHB-10118-sp) TaxID=650164 RepID=K5X1B6_PHACS|nr:uncharacterized protein PHACADRAFT_253762 [Phanerochaete carnosa HHB-10118-sp]EKM56562.1 hypothetical protein PHACADRAFT_253762 [Phanerochaete carnosa HHB-10118-sp]
MAVPKTTSERDNASLIAKCYLYPHTERLDGSLSLFIAICALVFVVFVVILSVASTFWGIYSGTRLCTPSQQASGISTAELHLLLLFADPIVTPPLRWLHIRSPATACVF